jgi:hypothetical protein
VVVFVDESKGNFCCNGNGEAACVVSRYEDTLPLWVGSLDGRFHRCIELLFERLLVSDAKVRDEFGAFHSISFVVGGLAVGTCAAAVRLTSGMAEIRIP